MLWTLIKVILFVALIAAAAWGAGLLMEADGGVRVSLLDMEFTLGPLQTVVALLLLVLAIWILLKIAGLLVAILRFMTGDETALTRYFARNRERKGYDAFAEGMMALASGDGRTAMSQAQKAERLLNRPDLTTLLKAQAAEQQGDRTKAIEAYKALVTDERTKFVGVRGLMKQKLLEGDTSTAMKLAEKALALRPKDEDTQDTLLTLQANSHDWAGARKTLGTKLKHGKLPRDVHKRRDAVLALGEAKDILNEDNPIEAREAAIEANRLSPDLIPAAVIAADGYVAQNKPKNATRVLRKAWEAQPHPDLAAAFARIAPEESAADRVRRFTTLTNIHPDHPETQMLKAELAIANEDFPAARKALGDLAETDPTARSLTIMAAIERGSGADDAVVKGWLARALTAPRGPQWVCESCNKAHADWNPTCDNCGGLDTMSWRRPKLEEAPMPAGAEMLPLIVGQIEAPKSEPEVAEAETVEAEPAEPEVEGKVETRDDTAPELKSVPIDKGPEISTDPKPALDYAVGGEDADTEPKKEAR